MHCVHDLKCESCNKRFNSACNLLRHFALHANLKLINDYAAENTFDEKLNVSNLLKNIRYDTDENDDKEDIDSGFEDSVNPLQLCTVTLDEEKNESKSHRKVKKYKCDVCLRTFGWSSVLKRHYLVHTGQRPFMCNKCPKSFTRKFLLSNHIVKFHSDTPKKIPDLKPIGKTRKQDKSLIKRLQY